jgi:hypothetical protein
MITLTQARARQLLLDGKAEQIAVAVLVPEPAWAVRR